MILEKIHFDSLEDYNYLERYVNCGSPSGFTDKYNTSVQTCAKGPGDSFCLYSIELPDGITIHDFGKIPAFFKKWQMLIHPDMVEDDLFRICTKVKKTDIYVTPTSSSRTVKILGKNGWFLKLNYNGLIGRIERQIMKKHALSAIEVSKVIENAINKKKLPSNFYFYREIFSRVIELPNKDSYYEWGIVLREPTPIPHNDKVVYHIPGFSLFSKDDNAPNDPTILIQLIDKQSKSVIDYLFEEIICPIYSAYFSLILNCGLQLECHAQNTLFAIDNNFQVIGIVARDAESIDKDISLMEELGIKNEIKTTNYKCLRKQDYNYQIMHSFMFDFKLGEYLITPIIESAKIKFGFDKRDLINKIKEFNHAYIDKLPMDFFPTDGKWYNYKNIVHDRSKKRSYITNDKPNYR